MSPTGTESNGKPRVRVGTTRRRALAALAGAAALAAVPVAVHAAGAGGPVQRGGLVTPSKQTPAVVKKALRGSGPVVVAFLLPGITEDEIVQKRLNNLQKEGAFKDTKFIVYRITGKTKLGDLATMFDVRYTPAVAVIQGNDKLGNVWRGLVDEDIIAQSLIDARAATPKAVNGGPTGAASGITLARAVNAAYAKVHGISWAEGGRVDQIRLTNGKLTGLVSSIGGGKPNGILNPSGWYSKSKGADCFIQIKGRGRATDFFGYGDPVIHLNGYRFGKPAKSKRGWTLTATRGNGPGRVSYTYVISGSRSRVVKVLTKSGITFPGQKGPSVATVTDLVKAPALPTPDKIC